MDWVDDLVAHSAAGGKGKDGVVQIIMNLVCQRNFFDHVPPISASSRN